MPAVATPSRRLATPPTTDRGDDGARGDDIAGHQPPTTTRRPLPAPPTTAPLDSDGDGLSDSDEEAYGTNPGVYDTDGDGIGDGEEVFVYGTNPVDPSDHP